MTHDAKASRSTESPGLVSRRVLILTPLKFAGVKETVPLLLLLPVSRGQGGKISFR